MLRISSFIVAFVLVAWLLYPPFALAHAELIRSTPSAGESLNTSPQTMRLEFGESVSLDFSTIQVYDRARTPQKVGALGQPSGESNVIKTSLPDALAPGVYTVVWRVISAADGHVTAGSFAFRVRDTVGTAGSAQDAGPIAPDAQLAAAAEDQIESGDPFRWVIRAITMAGGILLLGGSLFTIGIASPTVADLGEKGASISPVLRERFGAFGAFAAVTVTLMLLLDLVAQIMAIKSIGFLDAMNSTNTAWQLLTSTLYGLGWFAKMAAALMLTGVMLFIWRKPRVAVDAKPRIGPASWDLAIISGSLFILGLSLSSHAAAVHTESAASAVVGAAAEDHGHGLGLPLPVLADWLHAAMASLWVGGLFYMALVLFPAFRLAGFSAEERRTFLAKAVPRFSRLAIISVAALAITGTYSVLTHSNDLGTILSTEYGIVLAVKVTAYCVLVAIGAMNLLRLTPALQRKVEGSSRKKGTAGTPQSRVASAVLSGNVRLEAAIAIIAVVCAAGLTLLPPPSSNAIAAAVVPAQIAPVASSASVAGYTVTLTTDPSPEGDTLTANVLATSPAAAPLTDVAKVLFRITPQTIDAGSTSYTAGLTGALTAQKGIWTATGPILTLDGGYLVTVIVERTVAPDMKAGFRLDLTGSALTSTPVGVVDVFVATDPSPPVSGTATLTLTARDGAGQEVEGATISVSAQMPARGYVGPTSIAQPVPGKPGQYTLKVDFVSDGAWLLVFNVERTGQPAIKTDASLDVLKPQNSPPPSP